MSDPAAGGLGGNNNVGDDAPPLLGLGDAELDWCNTCATLRQVRAFFITSFINLGAN